MAGYFGGMGGMSPGMGGGAFSTPPNQLNPQALAMMMAMQQGPQMPPTLGKSPTNAGAMPAPIASQPQNPMLQQLMQNPGMLQNLLRQLGGMGGMGGSGGGLMIPGTSTPLAGGFSAGQF